MGLEVGFRHLDPVAEKELDVDRARGVEARLPRAPDEQGVVEVTTVEQLDTAELHQFGVALALGAPLTCRVLAEQFADLVEVREGGAEAEAVQALLVVHRWSPLIGRARQPPRRRA
ncbi:hypothetical protein ABZW10_02710 [Kitasatospora sp. NPDC004723]|uniref:hypothetical protein n=1 Tax=Kitasatospora sp. NPDC004723 TaxID=3154288 RepID=UPI0033B13720